MTLTDFLLARIAEEEKSARSLAEVCPPGTDDLTEAFGWELCARVLAECEAKRRIVEKALPGEVDDRGERARILRILATIYADHPDYREEWKP